MTDTGRQDDAGAADGHAAGPGGGQGPGRRARRLHPPDPAPPHQPRHRGGRHGARPLRAHPRARLPVLRRTGQDAAGGAVPGRLAPRGRTRHHPRPGHRGPAVVDRETRRSPAAPRPGRDAGQDTTDLDELLTELDEEITKAGMRGKVAPDRPRGGTARPGAARTPPTCPAARSAPGRWARPTPRRTARPSAPPCSSP